MNLHHPNLTRSKTGWFSYRRRIPQALRYLFNGKSEYKVAFKTKDVKKAIILWEEHNKFFSDKMKVHQSLNANVLDDHDQPQKIFEKAALIASEFEQLPYQIPTLKAGSTKTEKHQFEIQEEIWEHKKELLKEIVAERYSNGWGYDDPNPRDPHYIAFKISQGATTNQVTPKPSLQNILDHYLSRKRILDPSPSLAAQKKMEKAAQRSFIALSKRLELGMATRASDLSPIQVSDICYAIWPNPSTRKKSANYLKAAFNRWNKDNKFKNSNIINVFENDDIVTKTQLNNCKRERRSFTPQEFAIFLENVDQLGIEKHRDRELKAISFLLAMTGTIESEALNLRRSDVIERGNIMIVFFRGNRFRTDKKARIERAIPIIEPLYSILKQHLSTLDVNEEHLFPFFVKAKINGGTALNFSLNGLIVNLRPWDNRLFSAYSLRHTFVDRADAADIPLDIAYFIEGRKSASDRIRAQYGTTKKAESLLEYIMKIWSVTAWGEFD